MPLDPTQRYITSLASNGDILAVGLADYRVEIFDLPTLDHKSTITSELWEVKSVYIDDDYIFISSLNEKVGVFDLHSYQQISQLSHPLGVLKMWSDEKYIYTTSYNQEVWIWDRETFEHLETLAGHSVRVNCVVGTDNFIITGDGFTIPRAAIRLWNKSDFTLHSTIKEGTCKRVNEIKLVGNLIFSAHGSPGEIFVHEFDTMKQIAQLTTKSDCTSLSINSDYIAAAVKDKVMIWNRDYQFHSELSENDREVTSVILHDNSLIYGSRNTLKVYDLQKSDISFSTEL